MPNDTQIALDRLTEAVVTILWRQWAVLGQAAARPPRTIVDIEALLLASEWFATDEARLTPASASWRRDFGALISMQRLRNLGDRAPDHLSRPAWIEGREAVTAERSAPGRGRRVQRRTPLSSASKGIPTLQLQLRLVLGVGAKADCMTLLLGRCSDASLPEWCVERESAYGPHATRKVTRDLAWALAIASSRDDRHGVVEPAAWWTLLRLPQPDRPVWQSWGIIFAWTAAARAILRRGAERDVTAYALGAQLDELTEALGDPLPWMQPLQDLARQREPGVVGFIAKCAELTQLLTDDG